MTTVALPAFLDTLMSTLVDGTTTLSRTDGHFTIGVGTRGLHRVTAWRELMVNNLLAGSRQRLDGLFVPGVMAWNQIPRMSAVEPYRPNFGCARSAIVLAELGARMV
jgi:hypothetical protein